MFPPALTLMLFEKSLQNQSPVRKSDMPEDCKEDKYSASIYRVCWKAHNNLIYIVIRFILTTNANFFRVLSKSLHFFKKFYLLTHSNEVDDVLRTFSAGSI